MDSNEEGIGQKDQKPMTARILSQAVSVFKPTEIKYSTFAWSHLISVYSWQDFSNMVSGANKGLPIKVPTIPIKVVTTNGTPVSIIVWIHRVRNILLIFRFYTKETVVALLSLTITDATVTIRKLSPLDCKKNVYYSLKMMGVVCIDFTKFFMICPHFTFMVKLWFQMRR